MLASLPSPRTGRVAKLRLRKRADRGFGSSAFRSGEMAGRAVAGETAQGSGAGGVAGGVEAGEITTGEAGVVGADLNDSDVAADLNDSGVLAPDTSASATAIACCVICAATCSSAAAAASCPTASGRFSRAPLPARRGGDDRGGDDANNGGTVGDQDLGRDGVTRCTTIGTASTGVIVPTGRRGSARLPCATEMDVSCASCSKPRALPERLGGLFPLAARPSCASTSKPRALPGRLIGESEAVSSTIGTSSSSSSCASRARPSFSSSASRRRRRSRELASASAASYTPVSSHSGAACAGGASMLCALASGIASASASDSAV